jgi:hypothetical protein
MSEGNAVEEELQKKITEEFKQSVIEWVKKDDTIRNLNNEMKQIKIEKKELEQNILNFMEETEIDVFEIGDGKLRKSVSKTKGALKQEIIQNSLMHIFKNTHQASSTTKFILDNRPIKETTRLKRTYKRNKKK